MSMRLPPAKLPIPLRVFAWLVFTSGIFGVVAYVGLRALGQDPRISRLAGSVAYIWAGNQLRRGDREGLDNILLLHLLLTGLLGYQLLFGTEPLEGFMIGIGVWVLLVTGYLLYCRQRLPWVEVDDDKKEDDDQEEGYATGSYGDWMSNRDYRKHIGEWFEHKDRVLEADRKSPPSPEDLIDDLFDEDDVDLTRMRLQELGDRATEEVVRAFGDARFAGSSDEVKQTLVGLVPTPAPPGSGPTLARGLDAFSPDNSDRKWLAERIASTGDAQLTKRIVAGLDDPELAEWYAEGLALAFENSRGDAELCSTVRAPLLKLLDSDDAAGAAASALAKLDPVAVSIAVLERADLDSRAHVNRLRAVLDAGLQLPSDRLRELFDRAVLERKWCWLEPLVPHVAAMRSELEGMLATIETDVDDWAAETAYLAVLRELVTRKEAGAERLVDAAIAMDHKQVSPGAASLLCEMHGLPAYPWVDHERKLTTNQRYYCAVSCMMSYTSNGGMSHAMDCLNDDNFAALVPALETIGPPEIADVWRRAIDVLGKPLPVDQGEREDVILDNFRRLEQALDEIEGDYWQNCHRLDVRLRQFAVAHADEIREVLREC